MSKFGAGEKLADEGDEECPVCHSRRYLNKYIKFLVNPECYHKICNSCVDRIFSHGPAPCPIAGCGKTLRRQKFRQPTFEDLKLEREIDIRRRVSNVFNRQEGDFETLRDYNDYLNEVEDATYNLINNIDIEATEKRLREYAAANRQAIEENLQRAKQGTDDFKAHQAAEKEAVRLRRQAALREEEEERRTREEERRELLEKLASGEGDAAELAKQSQHAVLRRAKSRKEALARVSDDLASAGANGTAFTIKGLKKYVEAEAEKPYDPFGGLTDKKEYFMVYDQYNWKGFDGLQTPRIAAGGYDHHEYYKRALCDTFSGLGIILSEELSGPTATRTTSTLKPDRIMDDVF